MTAADPVEPAKRRGRPRLRSVPEEGDDPARAIQPPDFGAAPDAPGSAPGAPPEPRRRGPRPKAEVEAEKLQEKQLAGTKAMLVKVLSGVPSLVTEIMGRPKIPEVGGALSGEGTTIGRVEWATTVVDYCELMGWLKHADSPVVPVFMVTGLMGMQIWQSPKLSEDEHFATYGRPQRKPKPQPPQPPEE